MSDRWLWLIVVSMVLGFCITAGLAIRALRRGAGWRTPMVVVLVAVLVLATLGAVVVARTRSVNVPAPVSASLTLFAVGTDCTRDGSSDACSEPQALFALRARDGSLRWEAFAPAGDYFVNTPPGPFLLDGKVYAYTTNRPDINSLLLLAWRASDGAELWRVPVPVPCCDIVPQTLVLGSQLAIVTAGGTGSDGRPTYRLTLLRASDGAPAGSITLPAAGRFGWVAADESTLYDCPDDGTGTLFAVRPRDGAQLWSVPYRSAGGQFARYCMLTVADGTVYESIFESIPASSTSSPVEQGRLVALRAGDGHELWHYATASPSSPQPLAVSAAAMFLGEGSPSAVSSIIALRASDGAFLWRHASSNGAGFLHIGGSPATPNVVAAGDLVLVGGDTLMAWRATDGAIIWQSSAQQYHGFNVAGVANGVVFADAEFNGFGRGPLVLGGGGDTNEYLYALRASDGTPYWQVTQNIAGTMILASVS